MDFRTFCWILGIGITAGTPLLYATLGEVISECAGILNLGVEGLMLMGAITGFIAAQNTGNLLVALLVVIGLSAIEGLILGFFMITLKSNQVATGIAYTFLCTGISTLIGKAYVGANARVRFREISIPGIEKVEWLNLILKHDLLVYVSIILVILASLYVNKTRPGLHLRAAGNNPGALDSLGVNVLRVRYVHLMIGCILAGLGGAYLSLAYSPGWIEGMAAGRGWLTIALVNFALWKPKNAIYGAYLYGIFYALSYRMEAIGSSIPSYFLRMIPYLLPILILIIASIINKNKGSIAPRKLAVPYSRETR